MQAVSRDRRTTIAFAMWPLLGMEQTGRRQPVRARASMAASSVGTPVSTAVPWRAAGIVKLERPC